MPPPIHPDSILEYEPKVSRIIKVDANVIAYFGDFFHAFREGFRKSPSVAPETIVRTIPANTASSQNQS
jgi:hypothetical protein